MKNRFVSGSYENAQRKRDKARERIKKMISASSLLSSEKKATKRIINLCNDYGVPAAEMRQMVREEILKAAAEIYVA